MVDPHYYSNFLANLGGLGRQTNTLNNATMIGFNAGDAMRQADNFAKAEAARKAKYGNAVKYKFSVGNNAGTANLALHIIETSGREL